MEAGSDGEIQFIGVAGGGCCPWWRWQERPDIARFQVRWKTYPRRLGPKRLVFINETWAKTNMSTIRGGALRGRRFP
jgi:hypothetical protein